MTITLNYKKLGVGLLLAVLVAALFFPYGRLGREQTTNTATMDAAWDTVELELDRQSRLIEDQLQQSTTSQIQSAGDQLAVLMEAGELEQLEEKLLVLAAREVRLKDNRNLAKTLSLMGQVAISRQDLDSAEVYLGEALELFENLGDELGSAEIFMQLGRLHLKSREMARTAGIAYDKLLVARWQINRRQYSMAENNLKQVVDENLSVHRYGAAASAYESMIRLYRATGDGYQAEQSSMEAARLFAASGQLQRASRQIDAMRSAGVESWRLFDMEKAVAEAYQQFQFNTQQIAQAQDFNRLYNHFQSKGDPGRAWSFRLQASKSLGRVSQRAMYYRQADVLAVLYNSNDAMREAKRYFRIADTTFSAHGRDDLSNVTRRLDNQVF